MNIVIDNQLVTLADLRAAWQEPVTLSLGHGAQTRIAEANEFIDDVVAQGEIVYGVNTGFGQMAQVRISNDELAHLQENLVRSHAVGVGEDLDDEIVRLIMLTKVVALAEGFSGVRLELVDALCALINHEIYPRIPSRGSVGASGDLAPLAHMAGALIGIGEVRVKGNLVPAAIALKAAGLKPITLAPKEGLALLNGTQVSTALALAAVFRTENILAAALVAGAMSSDAIKGSDTPFDRRIQIVRGHRGQIAVAGVLREMMHGSDIRASHHQVRPRAGPVFDSLPAAGHRRVSRRAEPRLRGAANRGERGNRQSAGVRGSAHGIVGWQLPRRAGGAGGRLPGARDR